MSCGNCSGARSAPTLSLSISTTTNRITNTGFSYDAAGNVLTDGFSSYIWNAEGRMDSTAGYRYVYDGDGRRVAKVTGGHGRGSTGRNPSQQTHNSNEKLYWYGLGGQVLAESDLSGNIISEYIYFSGQRIARRTPSGTVHYYLADRLGSARVMTNSTGGVVEESDFYPYGTERVITDTLDNNYKFTGHERDAESGLDHTLHRQYASTTGRWLSPDPQRGNANPQSWNRYAYAIGNPTNVVDPNGAEWVLICTGPEDDRTCDWEWRTDETADTYEPRTDPGPLVKGPGCIVHTGEYDEEGNEITRPCTAEEYERAKKALNPAPAPLTADLAKELTSFLCKEDPEHRILASIVSGAVIGAITGGRSGTAFGVAVGTFWGAFIGGVVGAEMGPFKGAGLAAMCELAGQYPEPKTAPERPKGFVHRP